MADVSKPGEPSPEVNSQQPDVGLAASRKELAADYTAYRMQFCCGSLRRRDQELLVFSQNNREWHFVAVKTRGQPPGQDEKESSGKDGPLLLHTPSSG